MSPVPLRYPLYAVSLPLRVLTAVVGPGQNARLGNPTTTSRYQVKILCLSLSRSAKRPVRSFGAAPAQLPSTPVRAKVTPPSTRSTPVNRKPVSLSLETITHSSCNTHSKSHRRPHSFARSNKKPPVLLAPLVQYAMVPSHPD